MIIKEEVNDFNELREKLWNCDDVLAKVEENAQEEQFMNMLEGVFCHEAVDLVDLNDYIRFQVEDDFPDFFDDRMLDF